MSMRRSVLGLLKRFINEHAPFGRARGANENVPIKFVTLRHPTQCVLWEQPERLNAGGFGELFKTIARYEDSSHLTRYLYECRECGQRYFYEWCEMVDWDEGNDKQYTTLIPVRTKAEITALKQASTIELLCYSPRPQRDGDKIVWIGKL
jgi:hypothetical protein